MSLTIDLVICRDQTKTRPIIKNYRQTLTPHKSGDRMDEEEEGEEE